MDGAPYLFSLPKEWDTKGTLTNSSELDCLVICLTLFGPFQGVAVVIAFLVSAIFHEVEFHQHFSNFQLFQISIYIHQLNFSLLSAKKKFF